MPSKGITRGCAQCGVTFLADPTNVKRNGGKYCSMQCYNAARRRPLKLCAHCGKAIPAQRARSRYCSHKCDGATRQIRTIVNCQHCGREFWIHTCHMGRGQGKYCSRECKRIATTTPPNTTCQVCGIPIAQRPHDRWVRKYCSWACRKIGMRGPNHPAYKGGDPDYRGPQWDAIREVALQRDNYTCQDCGNRDDLAVHHIVPWAKTQDNSLSNLVTLCRACHSRAHYGDGHLTNSPPLDSTHLD